MREHVIMSTSTGTVSKDRVCVKGKFLYNGTEKFYIKGVTYGTFKPQEDGMQFPEEGMVAKDFSMMAEQGINCVRTYTVPPKYLLDLATQYALRVMVGLPWEQHITFLDDANRKKDIIKRVQEGVKSCGEHPAILCFAIGNEIPSTIVRWYGKHKIEGFLKQLYTAAKAVDPHSLVTYVNFPTTEYLDLDFLDFDCFNVYLETPEKLSSYIARLHNLASDRPLVLAEIGLDSLRKGEQQQAETLTWQIGTIFAKGCAGMFVFAWTDEWWRGGFEIKDWDFGIVDRQRNPKLALHAVRETMAEVPFSQHEKLPFFSVIVCTYNGSATVKDCLDGLMKLNYPLFEVIVLNDGSTDNTANIASRYPVRLISTTNRGLSNARNTGLHAAKGDIIAYIDDDAYPDPHWLHYLAYAYLHTSHAGIGGPNLVPDEDGPIAKCVANAPGGPVHVLISDEVAEHIPGCNMSFRKEALLEVGGFDPAYRTAGDDVDICWRVQDTGKTIGFHASAMVWHHRRNSLMAYWKQQKGYGRAEALLEAKWPEKYNGFGHYAWAGRIYGNGLTSSVKFKKDKIFYGTWGTALFQSVYQPANGVLNALPLMPEWYLFCGLLAVLASLGFLWLPLLWLWPVFAASVGIIVTQAAYSASKNVSLHLSQKRNLKYRLLITLLHIIQPIARLYGRLQHGLTPWRKRGAGFSRKFILPFRPRVFTHWSEEWQESEQWLKDIEKNLTGLKLRVKRGGDFDDWDMEVRSGIFSNSRALLTIEEHGGAKQYLRLRCKTIFSPAGLVLLTLSGSLAVFSTLNGSWLVGAVIGAITFLLASRFIIEAANGMNSLFTAFKRLPVFGKGNDQQAGVESETQMTKEVLTQQEEELQLVFEIEHGEEGFLNKPK